MKTNEWAEEIKSKMCSAEEVREKIFAFVLVKWEFSSQYQSNQIESFDFLDFTRV
jgi:hypothetical protein